MADYTVRRLDPDPCDYSGCTADAHFEVGIDRSPVSHRYACKQHVPWAGEDALRRYADREERRAAHRRADDDGREGA